MVKINQIFVSVYIFILFIISFLFYVGAIPLLHYAQISLGILLIISIHTFLAIGIYKYKLHKEEKLDLIFKSGY